MKPIIEDAIADVENSFREMAEMVLSQLTLLDKYISGNHENTVRELIDDITENERKIDSMEVVVSEKFINTVALYQPVALDVRRLVSIYRITINLERIGDLVMNIIYSAEEIRDTAEYKAMSEVILNMLISGKFMVEKSLLSFENSDKDYAVWTIKNDEVVDDMNRKLLINSISKANVSKKTKEMLISYADLKNIITNIERIADHATNIAEASIYSMQGTDIRHTRQIEGDLKEE
ncbi:MAG: PhoU domain-containing protein [Bacteroidales bacterium]|jgi:phosphate transport system protein